MIVKKLISPKELELCVVERLDAAWYERFGVVHMTNGNIIFAAWAPEVAVAIDRFISKTTPGHVNTDKERVKIIRKLYG